MPRHAAYCGLYCGACCSMITHEKEQKVESALEMRTKPDELPCQGCDADYQSRCAFVICNREHGSSSCAFCPEFPCARLLKFKDEEWEHHRSVLDNLHRIKEIGIEAWVEEQQRLWQCPDCKARTQWYQGRCDKCGKELPPNY